MRGSKNNLSIKNRFGSEARILIYWSSELSRILIYWSSQFFIETQVNLWKDVRKKGKLFQFENWPINFEFIKRFTDRDSWMEEYLETKKMILLSEQ